MSLLREHMGKQTTLYIKYGGGENPGTIRGVRLQRWHEEPISLMVYSISDSTYKKYLVARILDCRISYWSE